MRTERRGTPFKRHGMQNYVGLYNMYAFMTSVAQVWVQKKLKKWHSSSIFENKKEKENDNKLFLLFKTIENNFKIGIFRLEIVLMV